jgi:hypothetical protein
MRIKSNKVNVHNFIKALEEEKIWYYYIGFPFWNGENYL